MLNIPDLKHIPTAIELNINTEIVINNWNIFILADILIISLKKLKGFTPIIKIIIEEIINPKTIAQEE
ncbi:hypothetical protein [Mycoplasmopsis cricetuli]|uniref:hypothetical protein n=1 Tax=Mycoplasmopsis cricetuli TaxID=171283 RepID=UPI0012EB3E29|nr:hypothetical protein [Mycoplasmopsis cricetuli]